VGRKREPLEPLDVAVVQASFELRDGQIIRLSTSEPATFAFKDKPMVRVYIGGKIKRVLATRIAWVLACGAWPSGIVRLRDGDESNFSAANLIVVKRGQNPFSVGTSSLKRRAEVDSTLIKTLAAHPGATLPMLSQLIGAGESCCCTRLGRLEKRGLTCSPRCQARLRWDLTPAGRELATSASLPLDDMDQRILGVLVLKPLRQLELARRVGCCSLTAKRRINLLIDKNMVEAHDGRFSITDEGRRALGDAAPQHQPWIRPETVSAAMARDVVQRMEHRPNDDRSPGQIRQLATTGAAKAAMTYRARKRRLLAGLNEYDNLDMTG
jgi:hypothetical protein